MDRKRKTIVPAFLLAMPFFPATVLAAGGQLSVTADLEYLYGNVTTESKDTPEKIETEISRLKQEYDVELQKEIFPYLNLNAGGLFELIDSETITEGIDAESEERARWLFVELNLDNPLYRAGTAYRQREFESGQIGSSKTEIYRKEFAGLFRWRPVGLPVLDLDYSRVRAWDDAGTRDSVRSRLLVKGRYDYKNILADLSYTRDDDDQEIRDSGSLTQSLNGNVNYTTRFYEDRILMTSSARLSYQGLEPLGGGVFEKATDPRGSAFYLSDDSVLSSFTPVDSNNPLTTINIGKQVSLAVDVGLGLDFGLFPTDVDTLHLLPLIDPEDPLLATPGEIAAVAGSYTWTVFSSDDTNDWGVGVVATSHYDAFDNRFEISFPRVDGTRYIKVVTTTQPNLTQGEIRFSGIRAFTTIPVSPGMKVEDFDQTYNLGFQWPISDATTASYDGFFRITDAEPFDNRRTTLTNSFSFRHSFSPKLFTNARLLRTDTTETDRDDTVHHSYTASLTVDHLDTLRQTLIYSGNHDKLGDATSYSNALYLRTKADLYEGWSANADLGFSRKHFIDGDKVTTATHRISTNLDPSPEWRFALNYLLSWNTQTGQPSGFDHVGRIQSFWVPWRTLSFFAGVSFRKKRLETGNLNVSQDFSANWAIFPDGLLNFSLAYNRSVDTRDNETQSLSPQIDWQLSRTIFLNVRFNIGKSETETQKSDVMNIRATLRASY
jgi:hypothetical protein